MKRATSAVALFLAIACFALPAFADCTPGTDWTSAWTDSFGQTTYTLEAPCLVYLTIPFDITATVTDSTYPDSYVAFGWSIKDNGTIIDGGGFNLISLVNGQWQQVVTQTYTGTPINHLLQFGFTDLGTGASAHWWGSNVVGQVTVDPNPPVINAPPTADAGPGLIIRSEDQSTTVIQGTASDTDGDALTYRWLEGTTEIQSSRPVVSGAAPLDLSALPPLSIGDHTFTIEVTDGTTKVTDSMVLSVENSAPVAAPSAGGTFQVGDPITLNGTVADFDGDSLSYKWLEGANVLAEGQISTPAGGAPVALPATLVSGGLPIGTHTITLQVTDGVNTVNATTTVSVIDTIAPTMAPVSSATILWPPNGAMTEVTINVNARDNSGGPALLGVLLTTNQPPQKDKDGKRIADWSIVKIDQDAGLVVLQLRNTRSGKGGDRIYDVKLTATDQSGNASTAELSIIAPHDKRRQDVTKGQSDASNGSAKKNVKKK